MKLLILINLLASISVLAAPVPHVGTSATYKCVWKNGTVSLQKKTVVEIDQNTGTLKYSVVDTFNGNSETRIDSEPRYDDLSGGSIENFCKTSKVSKAVVETFSNAAGTFTACHKKYATEESWEANVPFNILKIQIPEFSCNLTSFEI